MLSANEIQKFSATIKVKRKNNKTVTNKIDVVVS